jgi:hypothetical protein
MALTPRYSNAAVNAKVDALTALLAGGFLDLYDGTQPATVNTVVTTQTRLARLTFGTPAFGAGVAGVATANAIGDDVSADASGTATWYRCSKADGTAVCDGSVGLSGANVNLSDTAITAGVTVSITSFVLTESKG